MLNTIGKILVVLNNFEKVDGILEKALTLSTGVGAVLEVLYVHEKSLFDVPDYFQTVDADFIDKEKIKKEIKKRLLELTQSDDYAIFVFVDDTIDRVLNQIKEPNDTLVVTLYEEKITQKLVAKCDTTFLVVKNDKVTYKNIIMPVDLSENSVRCINVAKGLFPQSNMRLLYDNSYVLLKEARSDAKELFEVLKQETNLEGEYIQEQVVSEVDFVKELYSIEKHLANFINKNEFDLTVLYSHHRDFLFSNSLSFAMLELLQTDLLLLKSNHE